MNAAARTPIEGTVPWPEEFADKYRRAGYWTGQSIGAHIAAQVRQRPNDEAIIDGSTRLSYSQLWSTSSACAQGLLDRGLQPGDRIVVQLPNCWQFVTLTLACLRTGIIPVMALPAHRGHELRHLVTVSEARAMVIGDWDRGADLREIAQQVAGSGTVEFLLIHGELSDESKRAVPEYRLSDCFDAHAIADDHQEPNGADVACMLLSGGTTGLPKLIVRTHDDYAYNVIACNVVSEFSSSTVYLGSLPSSHNFPLACPGILGALFAGGRVVMLSSPEPHRALTIIDRERVTVAAAVPAVAQSWIEYQREHQTLTGSSLKVLQVGGSRMPDELAARVEPVLGARLQQVFGMAEGLINMTRIGDSYDVIVRTQGRPVSDGDEIMVVDDDGAPVPDGTPGALLTRGPYTPRGYFRAPEANSRAFTADGWYGSGDIVIRRADGNLVVVGRDKDIINRGGEKISAEEVENFAYRVPGVEIAAAVAMPDPVLGERVCLYIELTHGHGHVNLDAIVETMNAAGVARYKRPERLVIVDQIPLTGVGKVDKRVLRDDISRRMSAGFDEAATANSSAMSQERS